MSLFIVLLLMKSVMSCSAVVNNGSDSGAILSLPCSRKYLSESYFEQHDYLLDLDFQGFLAHELPLCSCHALPHNTNFVPRLSVLQRNLIGEGSHRHLSIFVKFSIQPDGTFELPAHFCQTLVVEKLPTGVFADPFELQHLVERGVFDAAAVFGDKNLELPSALSNRSVVEVHMPMGQNILSRNKKEFEIKFELPLHARYPALEESGYSSVEMVMPDILLRCITEENFQRDNSLWIPIGKTAADTNTASAVVWRIPSGNKAHSGFVSAVTCISALLSTLLIILSAVYTSNVQFTKDSKQP